MPEAASGTGAASAAATVAASCSHKHHHKNTQGISNEQPWHVNTHSIVCAISVSIEVSEVSEFTQSFLKMSFMRRDTTNI